MSKTEPLIRNISDTAAWVAIYRAVESERKDAVFHDPFARRLAGTRGEQIMDANPWNKRVLWTYTARTWLVDQFVEQEIRAGADMIVNIAAGLDARPYRMDLPPSLQWIEIDLPELLSYKEEILRDEKPRCRLERIPLDLADVPARQKVFADLGRRAKRALVTSEGLIIYLTADEVCALGRDLAGQASFQRWATDLVNPGVLKMLQKRIGTSLDQAGAPLKFGPSEGPKFFTNCGWTAIDVRSMLTTAKRLHRLSFPMSFFALFPETKPESKGPWGGVCLFERSSKFEART